jgi:superfamily II DNA or RNA helicase
MSALRELLRIKNPKAKIKHNKWNQRQSEWIDFLDEEGRFLRGLLPWVTEGLAKRDIAPEALYLQEETLNFEKVPEDLLNLTLRDYQITAVEQAYYYKKGIVHIATGGGKCCKIGTLISTESGLSRIESIYDSFCSGASVTVMSESGFRDVVAVHDEGVTDTMTVTTSKGYTFTGRPNHRIRVLRNGCVEWVALSDICGTDQLCLYTRPYFSDTTSPICFTREGTSSNIVKYVAPTFLTTDYCYFLGAIVGDGHVTTKNIISFTSEDDPDSQAVFFSRVTGVPFKVSRSGGRTPSVEAYSAWLQSFLSYLGINSKSHDKKVPDVIFSQPKESVAAFLQGLYDTDGYCDGKRHIQFSTSSVEMSKEVQLLLLQFGIVSKRKPHMVKGYDHTYWKLDIYGADNFIKFYENIGFRIKRKQDKLEQLIAGLDQDSRNSDRCVVNLPFTILSEFGVGKSKNPWPYCFLHKRSYISKKAILKIIKDGVAVPNYLHDWVNGYLFFDTLHSVVPSIERCFDLTVEGDPSYVSDGFISHNTLTSAAFNKMIEVHEGGRTLTFVNKTNLLKQTARAFKEYGLEDVGIIGAGVYEPATHTVVMVQTANKLLKRGDVDWLDGVKSTIYDEVHHLGADTWTSLAYSIPCDRRIGMSGTPFREGVQNYIEPADVQLLGLTGGVIVRVSASYLIARGLLAKPYIFMIPNEDTDTMCENDDNWHEVEKAYITSNGVRNAVVVRATIALVERELNPLLLVSKIAHGQDLLLRLWEAGLNPVFLSGGDKKHTVWNGEVDVDVGENQEDAVNDFLEGRYNVLIGSTVFDEGVDLPAVPAIVNCAGGKSFVKNLQRIGRGLRPKKGTNEAYIFDFYDFTHPWLTKHSKDRIADYKTEEEFVVYEDGYSASCTFFDEIW